MLQIFKNGPVFCLAL